jgi:hypothetical protein
MSTTITINDITGATPYDVYLCDYPTTICVYIDTINSAPHSFDVPPIMESQTSFNLKIIDNNGCEVITFLDVNGQPPCPEYLGYDLQNTCLGFSVDFFIRLPEVLFGSSPCLGGPPSGGAINPPGNCPNPATVTHSINGGPSSTTSSYCFGAAECGYALAGCDCLTHHIESVIDLSSYSGQSVTVDYIITYPSSPSLTFTESITATIPNC